jgi:hypothetical protein
MIASARTTRQIRDMAAELEPAYVKDEAVAVGIAERGRREPPREGRPTVLDHVADHQAPTLRKRQIFYPEIAVYLFTVSRSFVFNNLTGPLTGIQAEKPFECGVTAVRNPEETVAARISPMEALSEE